MIDRLDPTTVDRLEKRSDGPWISIHLSTERAGPNAAAKIQFKNLLSEGAELLESQGTNARVISSIRERGNSLLADAHFWGTLSSGLAVFLASSDSEVFRLGEPADASVRVTDRPHVEVLRLHENADRPFAVLALSLQHVRLLRGNRYELIEDDPPELPTDMADALGTDDREPQLQSHAGGRVGGGRTTASFHGHEASSDADVERFMRLVDEALAHAVPADLPVVLAGVDRTVASFRAVSRHHELVEGSIRGNADRTPAASLHEKAWAMLEEAS